MSGEEIKFMRGVFERRAKEFLENTQNYPREGARVALFDDESFDQTYAFKKYFFTAKEPLFKMKGKDGSHLANSWEVESTLEFDENGDDSMDLIISNIKVVSGSRPWNLFEEILYEGTVFYDALDSKTKPMNYFDRYRGMWYFNRFGREGINSKFVKATHKLVLDAYDYAGDRAEKETADAFGWGV